MTQRYGSNQKYISTAEAFSMLYCQLIFPPTIPRDSWC